MPRPRFSGHLNKRLGTASESLRARVKPAEIDRGEREVLTHDEREELHGLRHENRVLEKELEMK